MPRVLRTSKTAAAVQVINSNRWSCTNQAWNSFYVQWLVVCVDTSALLCLVGILL